MKTVHTPEELYKELVKGQSRIIGKYAIRLMNEIIRDTPVDTGHAQSNWIASFKTPFSSVIGSKARVNRGYQSASRARLGRYNILTSGPIFISNNVAYIVRLNQGYSKQAPAGFVEAAIERISLSDEQ